MRSGPDRRPRGRFNANRPFREQPRIPQNGQTFDSNGPNIKIRGSAHQIFERYLTLAREATANGDRIAAENFYQHAEHYFRINNARREGDQQGTPPRPTIPADVEMISSEADSREVDVDRSQWDGEGSVSSELQLTEPTPANQQHAAPLSKSVTHSLSEMSIAKRAHSPR
jgi:hypothetical protein